MRGKPLKQRQLPAHRAGEHATWTELYQSDHGDWYLTFSKLRAHLNVHDSGVNNFPFYVHVPLTSC
jgi:hypothetical protein